MSLHPIYHLMDSTKVAMLLGKGSKKINCQSMVFCQTSMGGGSGQNQTLIWIFLSLYKPQIQSLNTLIGEQITN